MQSSPDKSKQACRNCGKPLLGLEPGGCCLPCMLQPALEDPWRFDHYQLATHPDGAPIELGHGAMGITYEAVDTILGHAVALKIIEAGLAAQPDAQERFLREARAAARLRHPNVASVFYYGVRKSDGQCFYAMELVRGETVEARLRRAGPLPPALALEIIAQAVRALAAADAQGLVHRDLKPANLMLIQDPEHIVKVIDFGLAKTVSATDETDLTQANFVGTPAYASPEQIAGRDVDIRSDLYSLGVTLWKMLTGQLPFHGTQANVMHHHLHTPPPLARLREMPQPVVALLEMLLDKDPARRFQNPAQLLQVIPQVRDAVVAESTPLPMGKAPHKPAAPRQKARERLSAGKLYARGMALLELLDPAATQEAIDFFKRAIEQDADFALSYVGLASAYLEQEGFGGDKSLLDSAVELSRYAAAIDPKDVRNHTTLARAYFRKGWYPQCDETLQKALKIEPDDDTANALAALRAFSKHQFAEAYQFFRKAHSTNPRETWRTYAAVEIFFRAGASEMAEQWMQQALEREVNPQLRRLMECYRMMWRRKFAVAQAGFAQLPPNTQLSPKLQSTRYSVSDGVLYCSVALEDWPAVIRLCNAALKDDPDKIWARIYFSLALQRSRRQTEAQEAALGAIERGLEQLERPAQPDVPLEVPFYIAWAYYKLGDKEAAYRYLDSYLTNRTLLHVPLGLENPLLDVFKGDPTFKRILKDLKQGIEAALGTVRG